MQVLLLGLGGAAALVGVKKYRTNQRFQAVIPSDAVDVSGRVIIVTGANAGLGLETTLELAKRGAIVVMGCRNLAQGEEARTAVLKQAACAEKNVILLRLDLSCAGSIEEFVQATKQKLLEVVGSADKARKALHAVVCNAGLWGPPLPEPPALEPHMAVHVLGHHLLLRRLADATPYRLLAMDGTSQAESPKPRVVFVSSSLCTAGKLNPEFLSVGTEGYAASGDKPLPEYMYTGRADEGFVPPMYADTKLLNCLQMKALAAQYGSQLEAYAVCPGWCSSSLPRHVELPAIAKLLMPVMSTLVQRTVYQGSRSILYPVLAPGPLQNGGIYKDGVLEKDGMDAHLAKEAAIACGGNDETDLASSPILQQLLRACDKSLELSK